jgi:multidrug efflux pump subunit AcrA (membrane-fusion protein)
MQLEHCVEQLHAAARSQLGIREFYRRLLAEVSGAMRALGGAAWKVADDDRIELICQSLDADAEIDAAHSAARREALQHVAASGDAEIRPASYSASGRNTAGHDYECMICPVLKPTASGKGSKGLAAAVVELWIPAGVSPSVKQGWLELMATVAEVAADFHALDELRRLRDVDALHRQAIDLVHRIQAPLTVKGAAFELANEGRRVLGCDRLSVVVRRGGRWRLLSASGVTRVQRRTDFARRTERLADQAARWGEAIEYPALSHAEGDLPPRLASALEEYIDHSHARELSCIPISFAAEATRLPGEADTARRRMKFDVVLIAEGFEAASESNWRRQLIELGELCGPVLARTAAIDRFPMRTMLRWSDRLAFLRRPARLARAVLIVAAIAAAIAALVYVPADFNVEAPATLATMVQRDVFATATGAVAELHASHGQQVQQGDVLAVLSDPELLLKLQQVRGEMDTTRKRLDALAVTRTDRTLRESESDDRLPLAAEQRQLEERLASLEVQRQLLETRREALTIRSPIAGQVLTHDVDTLLESRPVERGQVLLTIADTSSGWQLVAEVPQRQIGHLLAAQNEHDDELTASYRLVGDVRQSYAGRVVAVSAAAPLEAEGLEDEAPPVDVRIAVDGDPPAAVRPGMSASVRIHCGQRSLGYVWLHDVGATIYRWATF